MSMDSNIDIELLSHPTQKDCHIEKENKTEDIIEPNKTININVDEVQKSLISKEKQKITEISENTEKISLEDVNKKKLFDENSKNIDLSITESCEENVFEEGNLQTNKLSLQDDLQDENKTNIIVTVCQNIQSSSLDKNITKNVSQEKNSEIQLMISNIIDKNEEKKLSDNVNIVECIESQKCSEDVSEETESLENVNVDTNDLNLTEKEINDNVLENSQTEKQSLNEKNNSDNKKTDSKETLEDHDKNITEKNIIEPENTEFVQFSQEKHGDAQIENQSIDAEDPFGGDNLITENIESMETEDLNETNIDFSKLCNRADNLQDVVNNGDSNCSTNKNDNNDGNKDSTIDILSQNVIKNSNKTTVQSEHNENLNTEVEDSTEKCNDQTKKTVNEISMDTEEEQSNVLPGQDDELCIIPDSMKVIIPEQTEKSNSNNKESLHKNHENSEDKQICENNELNTDTNKNLQQNLKDPNVANECVITDTKNIRTEKESINKITAISTDVINIDEESKNSEIEEITAKEICKQCNEERSCKIKVKIGFDTYNVCSKTCKALFKIANNRATDIPSDGVNSKREKRCANCLLIVEPNDERNLSWETMEFCNEECLGKFQTKYGSYCRNCNGSVQAVSLGKYCVRFGYDVRQFCCSTCLEEFKKGLKVCSYCQKDISSSTEGFLAPVGDKGQFKDFCTQDCMEKYSKMSSIEPPNMEKKCCSVCQEVRNHFVFLYLYF